MTPPRGHRAAGAFGAAPTQRTGLAGLAVLAASLGGCAVPGFDTAPPLRGTLWQVQPAQAPEMSPPRPPELLLDPTTDRYSGFTGCNRIHGRYALDGGRLQLNPGITTHMACAGESGAEEARWVQALPRVQGWQQAGAELRLLDAAGQPVLRLRAGPPAR